MSESSRPTIEFPARIGVWWASETWSITDAQDVAREIEALGYGSLFIPEVTGKECLTQSAAFLSATDRLVIGTGIANIHIRLPSAAETGGRTLGALHPNRFVLGLGVSHAPLVEHGMGGTYSKPLATMRGYLEKMAAVSEAIEPGAPRPTRLLAALGPKMIELSGTHADGAHPYLVTPEQTRTTRDILGPTSGSSPSRPSRSAATTPTSCAARISTSRSTADCRTTGTRGCVRDSTNPIWCAAVRTGWPAGSSAWGRSTRRPPR